MFNKSEKIFTVYEKPEAPEPVDRVILVREGFSFWAFVFTIFWLLAQRMWLVFFLYLALATALGVVGEALHWPESLKFISQLWLQVMLAYHAHDLQGWTLARRGWRMAGVLVAESPMYAERRYYEYAA